MARRYGARSSRVRSSRGTRRFARRSGSYTSRGRSVRRRASAGGGTVRLVIEQAPPRESAAGLIGAPVERKPVKAQF